MSALLVRPLAAAPFADTAHAYLSAGWYPIPLPYGQKQPPPKGYTGYDAMQASGADIHSWCEEGKGSGNVALHMPDTVLGLDVDAYGNKAGATTLAEAEQAYGPLPADTYVSTSRDDDTVSGIRFYRVPAGLCWRSELGPGVELVHHGHRYAVVSPSLHPEGRTYQWLFGPRRRPVEGYPPVANLPGLPEAWVAALSVGSVAERRAKASVTAAQVHQVLDTAPSGELCRYLTRLLQEAVSAMSSAASRHEHTRDYVARMVRAGEQGHQGSQTALDSLQSAFLAAIAGDATRADDPGEWDRMVQGAVALVLGDPTLSEVRGCCGSEPPTVTVLDDFWTARPELAAIHGWARARRAAPSAVLAVVLARVIAATPPTVVLPPLIGGEVSLNLFFALVGSSGGGKGAAERAGAAAIDLGPYGDFVEAGVGSGEGIAHLFLHRKGQEVVEHAQAALLSVPEVDTLAGLKHRQGSTLMPELRKAWMGEPLGFAYADPAKRLLVKAHTYRLNVLMGVQPGRAAVLLDDAEGGTPQRFAWLPTTDPTMPDTRSAPPSAISWVPPRGCHDGTRTVVKVCDEAVRVIDAAHLARQRGQHVDDALDGHALLCRLKVAAALGILNACAEVNDEDWHLAGQVMAQSGVTRAGVVEQLRAQQREANERQAHVEATREVIKVTRLEDDQVQKVGRAITRWLRRNPGWANHREVRSALAGKQRGYFDQAIEKLVEAGQVEAEDRVVKGQDTRRYRLPEDA